MISRTRPVRLPTAVLVTLILVAAACSDGDDDAADPVPGQSASTTTAAPSDDPTSTSAAPSTTTTLQEITVPEITGPIDTGGGPIVPQPAVAAPEDYVVEEYFLGGEATRYDPVGELGPDGFWDATPAGSAEYRTRVLVRRPPAERFSGVVVVEWFNVSATEASPDWAYLAEEIGRAGHAYVGASIQSIGVVGGETLLDVDIDEEAAEELGGGSATTEGGLVNLDPERYGTLVHPGDDYAFDIYAQVGAAVSEAGDEMLGGLEPSLVIALGESQSAGFLSTYLNAVHPLTGVYDAALVHSRGASGPGLSGGYTRNSDDGGADITRNATRIRTDLDIPVLIFEAETDLTLLGYHQARQPDTDMLRTWEVAGLAHSDAHMMRSIVGGGRDGTLGTLLGCEAQINTGPHKEVLSAALARLVEWAQGGPPPPVSPRIELTDTDPVAIARDETGTAIGGIRSPLTDVPVAIISGDPAPGVAADRSGGGFDICALFGQTIPLDRQALIDRYGSADAYLAAFSEAADAAVEAGFLLRPDAEALVAEAEANRALFG